MQSGHMAMLSAKLNGLKVRDLDIWEQWPVAISEVFNSIFGSWRLRKLKECGWINFKKVKTPSPFGTGLKHSK